MQIFLEEVAKQLIDEYGSDIARQIIVFPNRRSALFFKRYLSVYISKPVLAPDICTINEVFYSLSGKKPSENLSLIFELYKVFRELNAGIETFDEFYYWGVMLVNDFDDVDKYLVNPDMIFQNLKDLKEIDEKFGALEPEVVDIIRKFWTGFDPGSLTSEKEDFINIWKKLALLYSEFKQGLERKGLAYDGMIMRKVIEDILSGIYPEIINGTSYHFVGLNALNKCEKELLLFLKSEGSAKFYWDYDDLYIKNKDHEAGLFIRENLQLFGQDLRNDFNFSNLGKSLAGKGKWKIYNAPSDVAQAKLMPGILANLEKQTANPDQTAIVLADENLLMPVINSVPQVINDLNITMGYPLYQTPAYSLVQQLIKMHKGVRNEHNEITFYHNDVLRVLKNHYINYRYRQECSNLISGIVTQNLIRIRKEDLAINKFFEHLFTPQADHIALNEYIARILESLRSQFLNHADDNDKDQGVQISLQQEYLFVLRKAITQFGNLLSDSGVKMGLEIYGRAVDRILRKLIIPFTGEPLKGLQVMGILETRGLDFRNVILLSASEGILPKGNPANSYIPYNLRLAFGLPTLKHQDSIYAYYFYRLIQRAENVSLIYNSSASGLRTGEMSRYLLQLKYMPSIKPEFIDTSYSILPQKKVAEQIIRTDRIQELIINKYLTDYKGYTLSPSALNSWNTCRMKFYYNYIAEIKELENIQAEVDSALFGSILHSTINRIYKDFTGKKVDKTRLSNILKDNDFLENVVNTTYSELFMHKRTANLKGRNLITAAVIKSMIEQIIKVDQDMAPFRIISLEKRYVTDIECKVGSKNSKLRVGGTIDRVDAVDDVVRILDYKTGKDKPEINTFEDLFIYDNPKQNSAAFQTMLYCYIYMKDQDTTLIRPSLYAVRMLYEEKFSDKFIIKKGVYKGNIDSFSELADDFENGIIKMVSDIMNPDLNFSMTEHEENCRYCPYARLCERESVK